MITLLRTAAALWLLLSGLPASGQTLAELTAAAEAGDVAAQTELALRYHEGSGVLQNYARAADWARSAATAGDPNAQNLLGRYLHAGLGVTPDPEQAHQWLTAAAAEGDPQHIYDLAAALEAGLGSAPDPEQAAQLYARAAGDGHMDAAVNLGVLYQNGQGVEQDFDQARRLYEPPALAGHARAQNNLGLLYVRGDGVDQDYARAAELFTAASEQGLRQAMTNLGVMYENGFGVAQDDARAAALYRQAGQAGTATTRSGYVYDARLQPPASSGPDQQALTRAAQAGDPLAQFQLGWLLVSAPDPDHTARASAARLFAAAAQAGYPPAMANLGLMYFEGHGVPQDYVLGQMWITLASSAGLPEGSALAAQLSPRLTPGQINEAQSMAEKYNSGVHKLMENQ